MLIVSVIFAILAILALYGEFRFGIQYHPFSIKQNSLYFLFQFLFSSITSLAFFLAHRQAQKEQEGDEAPLS